MSGAATEFKYVPLRDSHVLEHLPRRVGHAVYFLVNQLSGKVADEIVEMDVSIAASQQVKEMVS